MSQEAIAVAQDAFLEHGTWYDMVELQRRWMFERFARGLPVAFVSKSSWIVRAVLSDPGALDSKWSVMFVDHHLDDDDPMPTRSVSNEWVRNGLTGAVGFVNPDLRLTARARY